jgi:hypothetical protein
MKLPQLHLRDLFWLAQAKCPTRLVVAGGLGVQGYRIVESAGALRLIEPDNDLDAVDEPREATPEP